jgi:hypothetical protein
MVLGCSHPAERAVTPSTAVLEDARSAGDPPEVVVAPATDAGFKPCVPSLKRSCNPPAPPRADARMRAVFDSRVVDFQRKDDGIEFVVPSGAEGIHDDWTGVFLGASGMIAGTEFTIRKQAGKNLVCFIANRSTLPSEQVRVSEPERD